MKFMTAVLRSLYIFAVSSTASVIEAGLGAYLKRCSPSRTRMPASASDFIQSAIARGSICKARLASSALIDLLLALKSRSNSSCQTEQICRLINSFVLIVMSIVAESPSLISDSQCVLSGEFRNAHLLPSKTRIFRILFPPNLKRV